MIYSMISLFDEDFFGTSIHYYVVPGIWLLFSNWREQSDDYKDQSYFIQGCNIFDLSDVSYVLMPEIITKQSKLFYNY